MKTVPLGLLLLCALPFTAALSAGEPDLKPGMDKEREAMVAQWKRQLDGNDQTAIEKALAAAKSKASVAFGMSDWPLAVAQAAAKSKDPLRELLLGHLREHRKLLSQATSDSIKELFKQDVLDPAGEQVRAWTRAKERGNAEAAAAVKKALDAGQPAKVVELLEAMARCGDERFLPVAAEYLNSENNDINQAALNVFKTQAKDLGPDLRSPKLCRIWWLQSGQALLERK